MQSNSTTSKPDKPTPDFPLFAHATKRWAKKLRGQLVYFGPWEDPQGALQKYLDTKEDLHAGRTPRGEVSPATVKDIVNEFLNAKKDKVDSGERSAHTFRDYKKTTDLLIDEFGKRRLVADLRPEDFARFRRKLAKRFGLYQLKKHIQGTRSILRHAKRMKLIDDAEPYGPCFDLPDKKAFRMARANRDANLFTREEIVAMLDAATPCLRAMMMLAINCAFGNGDCGTLPMRALDLEKGWVTFPRPKTSVSRRCPLWPETVKAIRAWLAVRPAPVDQAHADLLFITAKGDTWAKDTSDNPVSKETAKLLKKLEINSHRSFYTLRHTFRTVADETCDQRACDVVMGHDAGDMSTHYVEKVSDTRLQRVASHVRQWLFGPPAAPEAEGGAA